MKKYSFQGKNLQEAKNNAFAELIEQEENLYIKEIENNNSLFNKKVVIEVIKKDDVITYIKEFIKEIAKSMQIDTNIEIKKREDCINITVFSDNNSILIGKNGRTLDAITTLLRQIVIKELNEPLRFIIDVGEYKEKQKARLIRLAKDTAREVAYSKIDVTLEPMNSYERRIIHETLSENKKVSTESIGEEPNRKVVIKVKEE